MDDTLLKVSEDIYFHYTNEAIESSELIPYYSPKDESRLVNSFMWNNTLIRVNYTNRDIGLIDKKLAILTASIQFYPMLRSSISDYDTRHIVKDTVKNLIENHIIHPFLLFVDGVFVKWSDITLYHDRKYTTLVVDSTIVNTDMITTGNPTLEIDILQLPIPNLSYTEKEVYDTQKTLIFGFNDKGLLDISGDIRIYMDPSTLGYIQLRLPTSFIKEDDISVPDECQLYPSNILVFKDNLAYSSAKIYISPYNTLTIDDGNVRGLEYKMFYDKRSNLPYNNVSQIINHGYLKNAYLTIKPNPEWLSILHQGCDYKFDKLKSYDENMVAFSEYLNGYNYREIIDKIRSTNMHINKGYISDFSVTDRIHHLFIYPKEFNRGNVGCMLFVNGILCNSSITEFRSYGVICNLARYDANSTYEFISFNNRMESIDVCTIDSTDPTAKYFNGYSDIGNDYNLYCSKHPDSLFNVTEGNPNALDNIGYLVDKSHYTSTVDGISFDSVYGAYNGVSIYKVPSNIFAYEDFTVTSEEDFNIHLTGSKFRFCMDATKYMIFINGYRIHSSLYTIILPSPSTPFNDQAIYFKIVLKRSDIVEVVYSYMSTIDEVYIEDLNHSSISGCGVDQMGYITAPISYKVPLSRKLHFFFVNGIKIPYDYLMDISYDKERLIVNMNTIDNLCVIGNDPEVISILEGMKLTHSTLDNIYDTHTKNEINIITNTFTTVSNVSPTRRQEIEDHALINEIVRYYYGPVNRGIPFKYTYNSSVYAEVDCKGNIVIDVMDAIKNVNIQKEVPKL